MTSENVERLESRSHVVQFHERDGSVTDFAAGYIAAGLRSGDVVISIATAAHQQSLREQLRSIDLGGRFEADRLIWLDAAETLGDFMPVGELLDGERFHALIDRLVTDVRARRPGARILAYGEMVDLLWKRGQSGAALLLEELWEEASARHDLRLMCSYASGSFVDAAQFEGFRAICDRHSHVIPSEPLSQLSAPEPLLRAISQLQLRAHALDNSLVERAKLERSLTESSAHRHALEKALDAALLRERHRVGETRCADAPSTIGEELLHVLAQDLRTPLTKVLTNARLLGLRDTLSRESEKRLRRVLAGGERLGRMFDQLTDVMQLRLTGVVPTHLTNDRDLGLHVHTVVDRLRVHHPLREIDVQVRGACRVRLDSERFQQVLHTLIGNAVVHGDPTQPVRIQVEREPGFVRLCVQNLGEPIEAPTLAELFEPSGRASRVGPRSDGLGYGLHLARHIVRVHDGTIAVESTEHAGTRVEVRLPVAS